MPLELYNKKLYKIAAKGDIEKVINLLKGDLNQLILAKDFTGTLLTFACKTNNMPLVKKLLEKGADSNKTYNKETPLLLAYKTNNIQLAKILLEKGADVNYRFEKGNSYLHEACKDGYIEMAELLIEKGADLNIKDGRSGRVPLHELCSINEYTETNIKILKLLIKKGADVNYLTYCGKTPLFYASSSGSIEVVKLLIENGAEINKTRSNGETPLHCAVDNNSIEIVKLLSENGADMNAIFYQDESDDESDDEIEEDNRIEVTPLNTAVKENYIEIAKHLILYVLLSNPEKPDYITNHEFLSNFWDIKLKERNKLINNFPDMPRCSMVEFLSDNVDKLAVRLILKDINKIVQAVEKEEKKIPNREAAVGEVENASYALLIKTRLEKLEERQKSLNLLDKLRITSKNEKEITLNFIVGREISSYLSTRVIKNLLSASLFSKSESTITDSMIQSNAVDSVHSKPSSFEQEDNKYFRQSLEEQAKENTSILEISKDSLESINNMMGSSGSPGLFANRKRKQDEPSNEAPEMNKLRRLEH